MNNIVKAQISLTLKPLACGNTLILLCAVQRTRHRLSTPRFGDGRGRIDHHRRFGIGHENVETDR
ncbi:hypothetical protein [Sphingomonas sp. PB4P5]|uniref:hypothetical protein n=1 Tax=Parasphingomonas puruogangriensis TaxID=3096155 RepID=UPI002FC9E3F6